MLVEIYIETENQIMRRQLHRYGYVISTQHKGKQVTVSGFGEADDTCKGTLAAAVDAATQRLRGKCELQIYVRDGWIAQIIEELPTWAEKGFMRGTGEPVKHAETWSIIWRRLQTLGIKSIKAAAGRHEYSSWIQGEIKRLVMENPPA